MVLKVREEVFLGSGQCPKAAAPVPQNPVFFKQTLTQIFNI